MAHRRFARILDDLEIETLLGASAEELTAPLGDIQGRTQKAQIAASGEAFSLFGRSVPLRGAGTISMQVHGPESPLEIDEIPAPDEPENDHLLVDLDLVCSAAVNPTRRRYRGPRLELVPRADTGIRYRHIRSMPMDETAKDAVTVLVQRARLPHRFDLESDAPPVEIHQLSGRMRLNLNLNFEIGWEAGIPGLATLLRELGETEALAFDTGISAGFGLAMEEEFAMTVGRGRGITQHPNRVRASISRTRQRELSFGARFHLTIGLGLGSPLELLLERIIDRRGWRSVSAALATLGSLRPALDAAARGDWKTLPTLVGTESAEIIHDVLLGTRAFESDATESIVRRIVEIAQSFERLAPEVRGLWETALDALHLDGGEAMITALETIAAIGESEDEDVVEAFLKSLLDVSDDTARAAVSVLEFLTGINLEDIVVGGATVHDHLALAAENAAEALTFLTRLNSLPVQVYDGLQAVLDSTSAGAAIRDILSIESPDDLTELAGSGAGKIAGRLVERALADATDSDLQRVKRWADTMLPIVEAADVQDWIRNRLAELDGELGFSLGLELELLTRRSRILDLEFDPSAEPAAAVLSDLGKGDIRAAVNRLSEAETGVMLVHDCVFTSSRSRVSTLDALVSLLGWRSDTSRRVTQDWVRLRQRDNETQRSARFSGGVVRRIKRRGQRYEGASWLTHRVEGGGLDMNGPFDPAVDTELRLSCSMREDEANRAGLEFLDDILHDLGFSTEMNHYRSMVTPAKTVSLALSLRLGSNAVEGFLDGLEDRPSWCVDARNALHRWFLDRIVDVGLPGRSAVRRGRAIAQLVRSPLYSKACSQSSLGWETDIANTVVRMTVPDREDQPQEVSFRIVRQAAGAPVPCPPFAAPVTAVQGLLKDGRTSLKALAETSRSVQSANQITAIDLSHLSVMFCKAVTAADNTHWPNPFLPLWLVIARLCRTRPRALCDARGVATVRIREVKAPDWEVIDRLTTPDGVPRHQVGDPEGIFPIES